MTPPCSPPATRRGSPACWWRGWTTPWRGSGSRPGRRRWRGAKRSPMRPSCSASPTACSSPPGTRYSAGSPSPRRPAMSLQRCGSRGSTCRASSPPVALPTSNGSSTSHARHAPPICWGIPGTRCGRWCTSSATPRSAIWREQRGVWRERRRRSYGRWGRAECSSDSLEEGRDRGYEVRNAQSAKCGMRNSECGIYRGGREASECSLQFRVPHSEFRIGFHIPHSCDNFHNLLTGIPMATDSILRPGELKEILLKEIQAADLAEIDVREVGTALEVKDGIARIYGLTSAMAGEMLEFTSSETGEKVTGQALNLEEDNIGAVIFGDYLVLREGDEVRRTGRVLDVPVGRALVGRVVDALGRPVDGLGPVPTSKTRKVDIVAPGIIKRQPVKEPLQTGIKAIDSMIPIGRGQRELIIGDRSTGKTAIAVDTIINQKGEGVICIYIAIGQKSSTVAAVVERLKEHGAMEYSIVVVAPARRPTPRPRCCTPW